MLTINRETSPKPLIKGDEVAIIAASSVIEDEQSLLEGIEILEQWGLICRPQNIYGRNWGYLAGDDEIRYKELHPYKGAPLLALARGGWGAARLLERPQLWKSGWMLGFSDVTSLLFSRLSAGFDGGIHGPLVTSLSKEPSWSKQRLKAILFGEPIDDLSGETWSNGVATGPLVVGNLTVITHLLGSRHMPILEGAILILEDTGEAPYRIDRMLTHLRLTGHLKQIAGLGFGNFQSCEDTDSRETYSSFTLQEILKERSSDLKIPVIGEFPIGHCSGNAALPLGRLAELDGNKGKLKVFP